MSTQSTILILYLLKYVFICLREVTPIIVNHKTIQKFWELIAYDTDRIENDAPNNSSFTRKSLYASCYVATTEDTHTNPQTHASNNSSIAEWFRCSGNVFTVPLPSNERRDTIYPSLCLSTKGGYTYRHTDWREGIMKYAAEIGSRVMI
jgi:hypothetical protein